MPAQFLENRARHLEAPLCWLIGIGSGSDRDVFARFDMAKLLPKQVRGMLLDEDLLLEVGAVPQFHEFVGVAGITVFTGKLAAAVWIDCPGEGHARTGATIQQRADGQCEIFKLVPLT